MKVSELNNLWVGHNVKKNFTVLICALDEKEAYRIANDYRLDSKMEGEFDISKFDNMHIDIDCDYVLTYQ